MTVYIMTMDKTIYKKDISNPKDRFELKAQIARLDKKYHDWDMDLYALKKRVKKWVIHYTQKTD